MAFGFVPTPFIANLIGLQADRKVRKIRAKSCAEIALKRRWTKPLRGRPEGRSPAMGDLGALNSQLSFL